VQAVHGPADLTWTEAAATLSTATGALTRISTQRIAPPLAVRWPRVYRV
jgi:hypothetical protein